MYEGSNFPTSLLTFVIVCLLIIAILVGTKWCLIVVSIRVPQWPTMLSIFSCVYQWLIYLPWWYVYSNLVPVLKLNCCLLYFVIYSGYKSFTRYTICKYFLSVHDLFLHFLNSLFWRTKMLILMKSNLSIFFSFMDHAFGVESKNSLSNLRSQGFVPIFSF